MKRILLAIIAAVMVAATYAADNKKQNLYIIDGHFFTEKPVKATLIEGIITVKTPNGNQAWGLILSEPLPKEALKYAVPKEDIPEADAMLDIYEEMKSSAIRFSTQEEEFLKVGDMFPKFKATDIDGRKWTNADCEGKVMVLNCWFTGCGPCRAEMPELSQWKLEMPDVMFFSSTFEKADTARPVLEKHGFNWIPLVGDKQFKKFIGNNGYPMTIVVDKSGRIAQIEYGTSLLQREQLKQTINSLR